jgi:DNA-binding response OmpR family regulator
MNRCPSISGVARQPKGLLRPPSPHARVAALIRRSARGSNAAARAREAFGAIEIESSTRTVYRDGQSVALTPMEFDLLAALLRRNGAVASRLELLQEVWGHSPAVLTRTVDTHSAELRRELEADPAAPRHIPTVRKAGYRLERAARAAS